MKKNKNKITIYMYSLSEKIFIISVVVFATALLIISFIVEGFFWAMLFGFAMDIGCMVGGYRILRSRIVLDEDLGVLKLYDFRTRTIPVKEIKTIERESVPSVKGTVFYEFKIISHTNVVYGMHMEEPKKGSKHWNHVNDGLKRLKRRIKELKKKKQREKE